MKYSALIVAAGSGTRMKLGYNKVYAKLKDGRSILETTISVFLNDADCGQIVVVTNPDEFERMMPENVRNSVEVCAGGASRQESVANGLKKVKMPYVMIHDGARPYITQDLLNELKKAMEHEKAALLMVPVKDTIKRVKDGYVTETFVRDELRAAQTPQVFATDLIRTCMKKAMEQGYTGTDDASLVEKFSDVPVKAVAGDYANYKITTPEDLH